VLSRKSQSGKSGTSRLFSEIRADLGPYFGTVNAQANERLGFYCVTSNWSDSLDSIELPTCAARRKRGDFMWMTASAADPAHNRNLFLLGIGI